MIFRMLSPRHALVLNTVKSGHQYQESSSATAVRKYHTHSIPLDMEDIKRDWDKPIAEAGLAAKTSVVVRVGALDLGAGTGSFRVREMMHRIAYPLGVHVRADVNLTDIEAACTDGKNRITEVIDLPTTGVNTERIWLLEHYADWFSVNLGLDSMYHSTSAVSEGLVQNLDKSDVSEVSAQLAKQLREAERQEGEDGDAGSGDGERLHDAVLDALERAETVVPGVAVKSTAKELNVENLAGDITEHEVNDVERREAASRSAQADAPAGASACAEREAASRRSTSLTSCSVMSPARFSTFSSLAVDFTATPGTTVSARSSASSTASWSRSPSPEPASPSSPSCRSASRSCFASCADTSDTSLLSRFCTSPSDTALVL